MLVRVGQGGRGEESGPSGYALRYAQAPPMLVQCGFDRGSVSPHGTQPWYQLGKVLPFSGRGADGHRAEFGHWWDSYGGTTVDRKEPRAVADLGRRPRPASPGPMRFVRHRVGAACADLPGPVGSLEVLMNGARQFRRNC